MKSVQDQIGKRLERDCFLSPNTAYDYFSCTVTVHIEAHDLGRVAEVNVTETVIPHGEMKDSDDVHLEQADVEFAIEPQPPNEVRVESDQPVPVLGNSPSGKPEIRQVRYSKKVYGKSAE